jgi:hypothetical protein
MIVHIFIKNVIVHREESLIAICLDYKINGKLRQER